MQALNILFITLEFRTGTFSGNGVYATAQVPVSSWHRLDAGAPWREFAAGVAEEAVGAAVAAFAPDVVLAVDWSALAAIRNLAPYCGGAPYVYLNYRVFTRTAVGDDLELVRGMEAAAMAESLLTVALSRSDAEYLAQHVAQHGAMRAAPAAAAAAAPGCADGQQPQQAAQSHPQMDLQPGIAGGHGGGDAPPGTSAAAAPASAGARLPKVLLPALREDVRQLEAPSELRLKGSGAAAAAPGAADDGGCDATAEGAAAAKAAAAWAAARPYFSCVVRLSPEKEPERFVELVEAMAARGLLQRHQLTPLLLGVANDEYAQGLKSRLRAAAPNSVILESFMGPAELAAVYRKTRLNFHPATYDAYGMTIVEAASQGAPSVVHDGGGAVGATDLMRGSEGEVYLLDLTAPLEQLAAAVSQELEDPAALSATSVRAMRRARSWDEAANAAELVRLVREAMTQCAAA